MAITLRSTKGSALTYAEMDENFTEVQSLIDKSLINVKDYGAVGDGITDDTAAIQAAINYIESIGGGKLYFPQGTFIVSSTLTVDNHNVFLIGEGEGHYYGTTSAVTTSTPATKIKYTGSGTPVIHFTCAAGKYKKVGGGIEHIFIHCGDGVGLATYGILITSRDKLTVRNVLIFNATSAAVRTECYSGTLASAVSGYDVQHCAFENVISTVDTLNTTGIGLQLTGGQGNGGSGQGNTSFNSFTNTRWASGATKPAVEIGDTDNNTFIALRANGGDTENPITIGAIEFLSDEQTTTGPARYNNIYGCEAVGGVYARAGQAGGTSSYRNSIYGYNISNGGIAPNIESGAGGSDNATLICFYSEKAYLPQSLIVPASGTIDFANTSDVYTDSRTVVYDKLYLYEHGNLAASTAIISGTTDAGVGTYSLSTGYYTRIGRLIFVNMAITWSAHTGTGNIRIEGLPFAALNNNRPMLLNVSASNLAYTSGNYLIAHTEQNAKTMMLYQVTASGAISAVPIDTAGSLWVSGCYQAES